MKYNSNVISRKTLYKFLISIIFGSLSLAVITSANADHLNDTRNILKEWVSIEKTTSQEQSEWGEEKALLGDILSSLNQEERILKETIKNAQADTSRTDQERLELISLRDEYQKSSGLFLDRLALYERQAIQLVPRLPIILQDEMGLLINKLNSATANNYSLSERAQTLISILSAVQKFDNSFTVANEIRTLSSGKEIEVKVLFLGLSRAFYVDSEGVVAGIGRQNNSRSDGGWNWVEQPELAGEVLKAINIYENRESPALISLPLQIISK